MASIIIRGDTLAMIVRIYIVQDGNRLIVLLGGGTKSGQKADIRQARILRDEYDARKANIKKIQKGKIL